MTALVALALLLAAQNGPDEAKIQAKKLLIEANTLFNAGKLEPALALYEAAYRAYPSPKLLYNVATVKAALDRPLEAVRDFSRFLEATTPEGETEQRALANAQLRALQEKLAVIEIKANPTAAVTLDGATVPAAAEPVSVLPGAHVVKARLDGHVDFEERLQLEGGQRVTVVVQLLQIPPPREIAVSTSPPRTDTPIYEAWWFWTGVGAVVVGAVTAGVVVATRPGAFEPSGEIGVVSTRDLEQL